jgi:hypothetical protein
MTATNRLITNKAQMVLLILKAIRKIADSITGTAVSMGGKGIRTMMMAIIPISTD